MNTTEIASSTVLWISLGVTSMITVVIFGVMCLIVSGFICVCDVLRWANYRRKRVVPFIGNIPPMVVIKNAYTQYTGAIAVKRVVDPVRATYDNCVD